VRSGSGKRIYRPVAEKRRIVELSFQPGTSVAKVALAEGVNSHQVFDWRRCYLKGKLEPKGQKSAALLPVVLSPSETGAVSLGAAVTENSSIKPMAAGGWPAQAYRRHELGCPTQAVLGWDNMIVDDRLQFQRRRRTRERNLRPRVRLRSNRSRPPNGANSRTCGRKYSAVLSAISHPNELGWATRPTTAAALDGTICVTHWRHSSLRVM
jgi:transposase-like protein